MKPDDEDRAHRRQPGTSAPLEGPSSDVAFSDSVKEVQRERGSRSAYARVERTGGFPTEVDADLRAFLAAIDTAFCRAHRVTLAGSTMPALIMSTYSPVAAL